MKGQEHLAETRVIRTERKDSALFYFLLESYEGVTSYSTLPHQEGDTTRDIELCYSVDFRQEVDEMLNAISHDVPLLRQSPN